MTTSVVGTTTTSIARTLATPASFRLYYNGESPNYAEYVANAQTIGTQPESGYVNFDTTSQGSATGFGLLSIGRNVLVIPSNQLIANQVQNGDRTIYFADTQSANKDTNDKVYCKIATDSTAAPYLCQLVCTAVLGNVQQVCGSSNKYSLASDTSDECAALRPLIVEPIN